MSVEVRELIIRAMVVHENEGLNTSAASPGINNDTTPNEQLITSCVEKILEILKTKDAR